MQDDVAMPVWPDAHPGAAGGRNDRFGRTTCCLFGWVVALALSACGGGGDVTPPASGASAPAVSGVTVSGPDGASLFVPDGATTTPVTFRIAKDSTGATPLPQFFVPAGEVYAFTPHASALEGRARVAVPIDPATPPEAELAVAQAEPGGIWTIHMRTLRKGSTLEVEVSDLSLFRVVRLQDAPTTAASARPTALAVDYVPLGLHVSIPGFAPPDANGKMNNITPYPTSTLVQATVESRHERNLPDLCPIAEVASVYQWTDSVITSTGSVIMKNSPGASLQFTPSPGPWTFDLFLYRPYDVGVPGMNARIAMTCRDAAGVAYVLDQYIHYSITDRAAIYFLTQTRDAYGSTGGSASIIINAVGGPELPTLNDQYRIYWERSDDGGFLSRTIGTADQLDSPSDPSIAAFAGWTHTLTLAHLTSADNGALIRARGCYTPPGGSEHCTNSAWAKVTVAQGQVAPSITRQPNSAATLPGETADFSIDVAGTPPPLIQWQVLQDVALGWVDIGSAGADWPGVTPNAASLVTLPGAASNSGWLFRAVVSNPMGSVTSDAVVWRVSDTPIAPTFSVQPAATPVVLGTNALLAAVANGTAPLSYQWSRDGTPLPGATGSVLALPNVQAADLGSYQLFVNGPGGTATSNIAIVSASPGPTSPTPPSVTTQPRPTTVAAGALATFRVAVSGNPSPACQWTRNGIVIPGAASCDSYTTPPATAADNGAVYNVVATNAGGSVFAGGAVLTVQGVASSSSWTFLPTGSSAFLYDVSIVGGDPSRVVAIGLDGVILRSIDGGATWARAYAPPPSGLRELFKLRFVDAAVGLAVGNSDILRTDDGGATWSHVWTLETDGAAYGSQYLQAVAWLDADTAIATGFSRVWRSTDRGLTWQVLGSFDFAPVAGSVNGMHFVDPQIGLVVCPYKIFRTTDGGVTWTELPGSFSTFGPLYGVVGGSVPQIVVAAGGDYIYRSTDAGATWTRTAAESGGYLLGLAGHGKNMVAVGEPGLVMRSSDDGATWSTGPTVPFGQLWGVDFAGATTFVAGSGGVLARHD
jgi:photosystem II stability/assembly factor-like uncharacterized protein